DRRRGTGKLNAEVAIADGVQAVARDFIEAERACHCFTINRIRRSCQSCRTQRQHVDSLANLSKSFAIPRQHFKIRQTPVSEQDWLRTLQMRVAGNHRVAICLRKIEESILRAA